MSPPQSLPPSPPAFARAYGLRTTHVFPSTPGASMDELSSLDKEEKEIPFRFPVPKGHLCAPSGVSLDLASEHGSIATIDENLLAFDLQRNPLASCGRKGVFHRAFLPNNVPSSSIPIFVASSTHGRSSSISALCKSPDADLITGWQTPSPLESLLGLSNLTELLFTSDKASRNQGGNTSSCAVDAAPWVHRRALLPTVSRRGKRMLALACLVVFILCVLLLDPFQSEQVKNIARVSLMPMLPVHAWYSIFTKLSRTNENSTLSMISQVSRRRPHSLHKPSLLNSPLSSLFKRLHKTPPTLVPRKGFHDFAARPMTGPSAALGTGWVWHEGEELAALIGVRAQILILRTCRHRKLTPSVSDSFSRAKTRTRFRLWPTGRQLTPVRYLTLWSHRRPALFGR